MTEQELLDLIDRAEREEWTELDLRGEVVEVLPPAIGRLTKLEKLLIGSKEWKTIKNPLTTLPPEIGQLASLKLLNLTGNQIINLPPTIGKLVNLLDLNLGVNKLSLIPREIGLLTNLEKLRLNGNNLKSIPSEIGQLTNLTSLVLSYNKLTSIPAEIGQLVNLINLGVRDNKLTSIPAEIGYLVNLPSLDLSKNSLTILPPEIGMLVNLTDLNVWDNQLVTITPEIGNLVRLTSLNLKRNNLSYLPDTIGQLQQLTFLDATENNLVTLPPEIGLLNNLTAIELNKNQLTTVPNEIGKLTKLTLLYLGDNNLKEIPPEIGHLVNLKALMLWGNQLTVFNPEIYKLINLTALGLGNNQIQVIPIEIGQLINLGGLGLGNNQLTTLPPEIGQLKNLKRLNLSKNQLSTLPATLGQLKCLESLHLYDNPLPLPMELLGNELRQSNPQVILEAYFQQCTPLHQLKFMLLGEGTVGKTSLAERLLHNQPPSGKGKTVGVEIWPWEVEVAGEQGGWGAGENVSSHEAVPADQSAIPNPHSTIRINLWDFGGQEIYHATHQFFLTHRSLYVLVVDARQDDEANRLAYWLQLIASFGGDSPVLLVVNKIDEARRKLAERELYAQYPNLRGILYTSCTTGEGIGELRHALAQTIATMPHVNDQIPTRWMAVKNKLAGLGKDFISYDKFEELCEAEEISHPATRATLAKLLHDLGSALHFAEENNLAGTHILQPDWVTHGIYNLLNAPDLQTKGVLPLGMVGHILDRTRYPFHKHEFLLEIMEKFELCFRLPEHRTWLIPTLLPPDRPDFAWPAQSQPAFQLHYTILLPSIIGRLMVRLHQHTWQGVRWRDGFVLAREGARAQVRAIRTQNRIAIWLDGDPAQRRSLLTLIRAQLDEIHASFAKLGVEAFVPIPNHAPHVIKYEALVRLAERGDTTYYDPNADANIDVFGLLDALETPIERLELLLHKRLMAGFDLQELKTLVSMDLGLDYDEYPQDKKSAFARELLLDCKRNGRLERLQNALLRQRP